MGICACCLYEPGYDDCPAASADARETILESILWQREKWVGAGMPWRGNDGVVRPADWSAVTQLKHLLMLAPFLAP